jgi:hypothetical protein
VASGFSRKRLAAEGQQGALRFADDVARGGTKEQEVHGGPTAYAEHDPSRCAVGRAERPSEKRVGRRIPVQQRIQVQARASGYDPSSTVDSDGATAAPSRSATIVSGRTPGTAKARPL